MNRLAVALILTLTACGGGGSKEPTAAQPTSAAPTSAAPATSSAPVITPETKAVREAGAATLAKCPCAIRVSTDASAGSGSSWRETWRGVYDPASRTTTLHPDSAKRIEFRIVGDASYIRLSDGVWRRLDFSKLPAAPKSPLASLVLADPTLHFALAKTTSFVMKNKQDDLGTWYDTEYAVPTAAAEVGALGPVLLRFFPNPSVYGVTIVKGGTLATTSVSYSEKYTYGARMYVDGVGVAAPKVTAPDAKLTIDLSTYTG